jgi:hypothetical protein
MSAEELVRAFIAAMDEAKEAAHRSVLDGTVSCHICRGLVLESNADDHYEWHRHALGETDDRCRKCGRRGHVADRCGSVPIITILSS